MEERIRSIEQISNFIGKHISGASLTRQMNNTLSYTLPYAQKANFEDFFKALDKYKVSLDISSYGISDTTLEEIFLMLTHRDDNGDLLTPMSSKPTAESISLSPAVNALSTSFESDKDSGVAIELGSPDVSATSILNIFLS